MKKILLTATFAISLVVVNAQIDSVNSPSNSGTTKKLNWKDIDLANRSNDHFMIQYGFFVLRNIPAYRLTYFRFVAERVEQIVQQLKRDADVDPETFQVVAIGFGGTA
jgi:hypothetical protein